VAGMVNTLPLLRPAARTTRRSMRRVCERVRRGGLVPPFFSPSAPGRALVVRLFFVDLSGGAEGMLDAWGGGRVMEGCLCRS